MHNKLLVQILACNLLCIATSYPQTAVSSARLFHIQPSQTIVAEVALPAAPKLEVISVRRNADNSGASTMGVTVDGLVVSNMPLLFLIHTAFDGHFSNGTIHGLPGWEMERYDIAAKVSDADVSKLSNLTQQQKIDMTRAMLRTVLVDRFQMKWHDDDKDDPVYDLVIAKGGSKLTGASPNGTKHDTIVNQGKIIRGQLTMKSLAQDLSGPVTGRVVIDKTGLSGTYDLVLTWAPNVEPATSETDTASPSSIFTAVEEQLGLKLQPSSGPVKSLVIDHIERPSEN